MNLVPTERIRLAVLENKEDSEKAKNKSNKIFKIIKNIYVKSSGSKYWVIFLIKTLNF